MHTVGAKIAPTAEQSFRPSVFLGSGSGAPRCPGMTPRGWGGPVAKSQSRFACQQCGAVYPKWAGRCEACDAWNSLVEEVPRAVAPKGLGQGAGSRGGRPLDFVGLRGAAESPPRRKTGIGERGSVCGVGTVTGSAVL